jgi:hypothetical protein
MLSSARPGRRAEAEHSQPQRSGNGSEATRRIEAARRRLKATIPPPPE